MDAAKSKKPRQNTLLPGKARLNCGVYFQMRRRKCIHKLNFIYEDGIKVKDKYFATT
jgi:hypothetical protein